MCAKYLLFENCPCNIFNLPLTWKYECFKSLAGKIQLYTLRQQEKQLNPPPVSPKFIQSFSAPVSPEVNWIYRFKNMLMNKTVSLRVYEWIQWMRLCGCISSIWVNKGKCLCALWRCWQCSGIKTVNQEIGFDSSQESAVTALTAAMDYRRQDIFVAARYVSEGSDTSVWTEM